VNKAALYFTAILYFVCSLPSRALADVNPGWGLEIIELEEKIDDLIREHHYRTIVLFAVFSVLLLYMSISTYRKIRNYYCKTADQEMKTVAGNEKNTAGKEKNTARKEKNDESDI